MNKHKKTSILLQQAVSYNRFNLTRMQMLYIGTIVIVFCLIIAVVVLLSSIDWFPPMKKDIDKPLITDDPKQSKIDSDEQPIDTSDKLLLYSMYTVGTIELVMLTNFIGRHFLLLTPYRAATVAVIPLIISIVCFFKFVLDPHYSKDPTFVIFIKLLAGLSVVHIIGSTLSALQTEQYKHEHMTKGEQLTADYGTRMKNRFLKMVGKGSEGEHVTPVAPSDGLDDIDKNDTDKEKNN